MRQNKSTTAIWLVVMFSMFMYSGCGVTGKEFPKSSQVLPSPQNSKQQVQESLVLRGVGIKSILFMKILRAGLYLPVEANSNHALDTNIPKSLSVMFYIKFSSQDFTKYTIEHMKPNLTEEEYQSLKNEIQRMGELFPNIKPGDTLTLSYQPDEGTRFIHNGQLKGTIEGEIFSKAIFSTWIGPKPIDHIIKNQILGIPFQPRR